jgi:nitrite reductase/ring-hydroxylating ferredoxin subunit
MADFVEAAELDLIPPGTSRVVKIGATDVALFNVDGNIYAIADSCAHAGASLAAGKLAGKIVTCRAHGLRYDVTTGQVTTGGFGVAAYPVKVLDGKVMVAVS